MSNYRAFLFAAAISIYAIAGLTPGWACSWDLNGVGYPPECGYRGGRSGGGGGGGGGIVGGVINGLLPDANNVVDRAIAINAQGIAASNALNYPLALSLYEQANRVNPYDEHIANNVIATRATVIGLNAGAAYRAHNYALAVSLYEQAVALRTKAYDYVAGRPADPTVLKDSLEMARAALHNLPGKKSREVENCNAALKVATDLLQREPGNTSAIATITAGCQTKQADAAKSKTAARANQDANPYGLRDAPNDKKKGKTKPILKDPRPVADNNDFVCTKWPANGKFWCTGTTGKYATRACKWCPGDKISNLCAKAPCDQ